MVIKAFPDRIVPACYSDAALLQIPGISFWFFCYQLVVLGIIKTFDSLD